jgi:hypothetical protein
MKNINRRESPRIDVKLRCHVTSPALWAHGAMYTENISRNGLLVEWRGQDGTPPLPGFGQIVTINVELPVSHDFGQKCIHCQGTVTRISTEEREHPLVALRVNYMDFRAFHDRIRAMEAVQPMVNSWMA